jgi:hypothetical protein
MRKFIISAAILIILNGSCVSQPPKGPEVVKRTNQANEILDAIEREPSSIFAKLSDFASGSYIYRGVAENTKTRFLIENSDIALPLMFERLDSKKASGGILLLYFIVFEKTKSAESIPYVADYIASAIEQETQLAGTNIFSCALSAALEITSLKLTDENHTIFEQRLDIAKQLRQWYENYKKSHK